MTFDHLKSIYRNYDIRGSYPDEINEAEAKKVGQALVELYNAKTIVIGHDYRPSSEDLHQALVDGILSQGADVISVGLVTSPMLYHAAKVYDCQVSVMVTASHMPAKFNGLKIHADGGMPIGLESGLDKVRDLVGEDNFTDAKSPGKLTEKDIADSWQKTCRKLANLSGQDKTKVVIDPANMVGIKEIATLESFPELEVVAINDEYDYNCPNHEANPAELETLKDLSAKVVATKADVGIAFDGDADRIGIVDEKGQPVSQNIIGILLALEIFKQEGKPGTVLANVTTSKRVGEVITEAGGEVVPCRVGCTYMCRKMHETGAIYAFELSGHHFFKDMSYSEGGALPALLLIGLLRQTGQPLSQLVDKHQVYFQSDCVNIEVSDQPEEIYKRLQKTFNDAKADTIDGLTLHYSDWWFNARPSANDPVIRLNLEADTKKLMEEKLAEVTKIIRGD